MKIELYDISNPDGIDLKTYNPINESFYIDLEIYIKIHNNGNEGVEMYDVFLSNLEGFFNHIQKKTSNLFILPKGILCHKYNYDDLYNLINEYIQSIKPRNMGELGLLMNNIFEYHDSFFDNKILEMKHYISKLK